MEEMNNNENMNNGYQAEQPVKATNNAIKFIIPIAVLVVLVLMLVGVAIATGKLGGNGKKKVADALAATFKESGEALGGVWETDEYKGMFEDKQMSINADLMLSEDVGLEMQYNMDDKISGLCVDVSYFGSSMLNAILYMDEEELSLGVPYYTDYVFYVNRTTLEEDIQNLVDEGMLDEETAEALIILNQGGQDLDDKEEGIKQGGQDILDAVKKIYRDMEIEKADSKMLEVNGEDRNCKGYIITVTGRQISDFFVAYKEVYEENEAFRNYFNQLVAMELGYSSAEEFLEYMDPYEEFQNLADDAAESESEVELAFYLYDGVIAQVYAQMDEDNYLEWNIKGGNFPLENMQLIFVADGYENTFTRSGSIEEDSYYAEYALDADGEELYFDVNYDKNTGDFYVNVYDDYSDFALSGNIDKSIPGSELIIEIESLEVDYEEVLSGDIIISNECGNIEKPEGEELDVMKLTEDDWYDIMEEILYNM